MSDPLEVTPEGLRAAAASGNELAGELGVSPIAGVSGDGVPTAAAVEAVHALVASVRADHAGYLAGRSGSLASGARGYEETDGGSASKLNGAL